ncbi:MAG: SDR family NAD(P)-dependent oxidoreductase [Flavobacteriales bacterium]
MKNYVIIGGSSGIGLELVKHLESQGHQVFSTYFQNPIDSREKVHYQQFDALGELPNKDQFPETIDGLVYCPGSINLKPFKRFKDEDFMNDFKLQVVGATRIIQHLLPKMSKSDNSSIVLFSTVAVQKGFNFHSQVAMSKGAIEGLTKALAAEFAPKIRVNAIAPSLTETPLAHKLINTPEKSAALADKNPLKKIGQAKEVANAVAFLLTEQSSWVTGQILHIDGGQSTLN